MTTMDERAVRDISRHRSTRHAAVTAVAVIALLGGLLALGMWAVLTWGPTPTIAASVTLLIVGVVAWPTGGIDCRPADRANGSDG